MIQQMDNGLWQGVPGALKYLHEILGLDCAVACTSRYPVMLVGLLFAATPGRSVKGVYRCKTFSIAKFVLRRKA